MTFFTKKTPITKKSVICPDCKKHYNPRKLITIKNFYACRSCQAKRDGVSWNRSLRVKEGEI